MSLRLTYMKKFVPTLLVIIFIASSGFSNRQWRKFYKTLRKSYGLEYVPNDTVHLSNWIMDAASKKLGGFYMGSGEVTNKEYRDFLNALRASGDNQAYERYYPDTTAWDYKKCACEPMKVHYFQHPAYDNYPVVNVTPEGAKAYCDWFGNKIDSEFEVLTVSARLPSQEEWVAAASGGRNFKYPFGPFLRNSRGSFLHNFKTVGEENIRFDNASGKREIVGHTSFYSDDGGFLTVETKSYFPNDYGFYNVSGNVGELLADGRVAGGSWDSYGYDIRIGSVQEFVGPQPTVGFRVLVEYKEK